MKEVLIYTRFNRLWHWTQAVLVILLTVTGLNMHFDLCPALTFGDAAVLHTASAFTFIGLFIFSVFWHLTTGQWRQYTPTTEHIGTMVRYYSMGIFKGEHHPFHKTELSKLNPLQRLTYLGLNLLLIPILVISGFMYYFYNDLEGISLGTIASVHTMAAYLVIAFLIAHTYLATTGQTPLSNFKAMVTGKEKLPDSK